MHIYLHICVTKSGNRIVTKFCTGVIIHANFGDDRFRFFWGEEGADVEFFTFLLTCAVVLKTLCQCYRACQRVMTNRRHQSQRVAGNMIPVSTLPVEQ